MKVLVKNIACYSLPVLNLSMETLLLYVSVGYISARSSQFPILKKTVVVNSCTLRYI